jgi:hypothetical protein
MSARAAAGALVGPPDGVADVVGDDGMRRRHRRLRVVTGDLPTRATSRELA